MPSDSTMAKCMNLISSLFDVTSAQEVPFGKPQYIHTMHFLGLNYQCPSSVLFIFADEKCVNLVVAYDCRNENYLYFP